MARILRVKRTADGEPGVTCYGCEEIVVPLHSPVLGFWDCPECGQPFEPSQLKGYRKALKEEEGDEGFGTEEEK